MAFTNFSQQLKMSLCHVLICISFLSQVCTCHFLWDSFNCVAICLSCVHGLFHVVNVNHKTLILHKILIYVHHKILIDHKALTPVHAPEAPFVPCRSLCVTNVRPTTRWTSPKNSSQGSIRRSGECCHCCHAAVLRSPAMQLVLLCDNFVCTS